MLSIGQKVTLPDGELAIVHTILPGGDVEVMQPERSFGAGPWIYPAAVLAKGPCKAAVSS